MNAKFVLVKLFIKSRLFYFIKSNNIGHKYMIWKLNMNKIQLFGIALTITLLAGCNNKYKNTSLEYPKSTEDMKEEKMGKITGDEGIIVGGKKKHASVGITVNAYLWRAALDAVSTLPIAIVDPFSGVITTDWYQEDKEYRYRMNILITSDSIRADAVRVNIFKQQLKHGNWIDVKYDSKMTTEIENRILTRARHLKVNN